MAAQWPARRSTERRASLVERLVFDLAHPVLVEPPRPDDHPLARRKLGQRTFEQASAAAHIAGFGGLLLGDWGVIGDEILPLGVGDLGEADVERCIAREQALLHRLDQPAINAEGLATRSQIWCIGAWPLTASMRA